MNRHLSDLFDLSGKIVLVAGGSEGIGYGMCEGLGAYGATVLIMSRNRENNLRAVDELRKSGVEAFPVICDIKDIDGVAAVLENIPRQFGKIDVLFCNASVARRKRLLDIDLQDFNYLMDINLRGTFFCALNCARIMKEQGYGKIICTASLLSFIIQKARGVYAMSKAAVAHMVRSMAVEFGPFGVTVNGVAPGLTLTSLNHAYFEEHPEELAEMVSRIPLGHPAKPEAFKGIAVFLASSASDHINGSIISIDGGEVCL